MSGRFCEIPVGSTVALVDEQDAELLGRFRWYLHSAGYAAHKSLENGAMYMHRFILEALVGQEVDHINHDKLDNRRQNLRFATRAQNQANLPNCGRGTSRFKGVSRHSLGHKWTVFIGSRDNHQYLGMFTNEERAARAYDEAARQRWGAFAHPNFPDATEEAS